MVIVLSGGRWTGRNLAAAVTKLRGMRAKIFTIYVGRPFNRAQLESVASRPTYVFTPQTYANLPEQRKPLLETMVFGGLYH